jgi:nitroreductase
VGDIRGNEMEFFDLIHARRSVRQFDPTIPVTPEQLQIILDAASAAPSAGNMQAYEIYVVTDAKLRDRLSCASVAQDYVLQAPLVLVFCTHPARSEMYTERGVRLFTLQDATIACAFAMLAASALGLSSVWTGAFDEKAVRIIIGAPAEQNPIALLPIGHAAEQPEPRPRRAQEEMVHWVAPE